MTMAKAFLLFFLLISSWLPFFFDELAANSFVSCINKTSRKAKLMLNLWATQISSVFSICSHAGGYKKTASK